MSADNHTIGLPAVEENAAVDVETPDAAEPHDKEESPMIDVHAPHGGLHTWKDFWIHLGTIALGLLIAIGLEQTAEWAHRLHQRNQLEEDLRAEGLRDHDLALIDEAIYDKVIVWLSELQRGVDNARADGGKTRFVYPARPDGTPDSPRYVAYHVLETEAWTTAQGSALLGLLPRDEAEIYARVYIQADQVQQTRDRVRELGIAQGAFETRYAHGSYPQDVGIAKLTPAQLDEYERLLADELEEVRIANVRLKIFDAADNYVLLGGRSEDDARKAILKANMPR